MAWGRSIVGGIVIGTIGLLSGCQSGRLARVGGPSAGPMIAAATPEAPAELVARAQLADPVPPQPFKPGATPKTPVQLPPAPSELLPAGNPLRQVTNSVGAQQAADLINGSEVRVKVRAWVNGRPIYHDELLQIVRPALQEVSKLPEPQRSEKAGEIIDKSLDQIIDQEVMYQDALKRLEKANPKALDKLKELVDEDYEKQVKMLRERGAPEEYIKAASHVARRMLERSLIAQEYARNRVMGYLQQQITLEQVQEYYRDHLNEYKTTDRVQWQDVFIAVGAKNPTLADARRFAEDLIARCKNPDDFTKLLPYDEGDSKFRGGEGLGQRLYSVNTDGKLELPGDIRPPELAPYLEKLKEGQIGPVVEFGTGVHIFRVAKREYAGQLPLNEQTQKRIRRELEGHVYEREIRQLVRELRDRSVICIIRDGN